MVAIKQVANSALPDIRQDEPAAVPRPVMLRGDNGQAVKSVQLEAQKKMTELLAKAKQRKKQAEEQLAPLQFTPVITTSSMPLNKQMALPNMAQQSESVSLQKQGALAQGNESTEQPQVMAKSRAKPVPVSVTGKASEEVATEVVSKLSEALTQSHDIHRDKDKLLPGLIAATRDNPEMPMVVVPSSIRTGNKEEMSDAPVSQNVSDVSDRSGSAVKQPIVASSEPLRESTSSLPLAEKKESTLGDDQTQLPMTQQLAGQPLAPQPPTLTQPEEAKTTHQAVMAAVPELAESEAIAGRRTLSYTFAQWKNSPVVTFELSKAGELTAITNSVEVQRTLQDNHHLLESENPLHFREERREEERERRGQQQSEQEDET
ncbi:type III secretion protein [Yersinia enterocolitica]|uniref:SpaN/EivJ family type III secretion system needle length determinant n=1 Tax=Yersinia enterocolitica TaxID=630 RepID=UPI001C8E5C98|nr:type III secretion protein [Yersinia enterocolitica]MBX9498070.1 type III secretion protein [Yersinia enterocolitica]